MIYVVGPNRVAIDEWRTRQARPHVEVTALAANSRYAAERMRGRVLCAGPDRVELLDGWQDGEHAESIAVHLVMADRQGTTDGTAPLRAYLDDLADRRAKLAAFRAELGLADPLDD